MSYGLICFYKKKYIVNNNLVYNKTKTSKTSINKKTLIYNDKFYKELNAKLYNHIHANTILTNYTYKDCKDCINNINPYTKIYNNIQILNRNTSNISSNISSNTISSNITFSNIISSNISSNIISSNSNITIHNIESFNIHSNVNNVVEDVNSGVIIKDVILLVQRKHTIGLIEFMRGKYDVHNNEYIIKLFNMMTYDEKKLIKEYNNFDDIRKQMSLYSDMYYKTEYENAKYKFNELRNHIDGNILIKLLDNSHTKWTTPEWGIPKGRKHNKESDINCAIREFVEESGIKHKNLNIYRNVKPLEETYKGINGVIYKHIYYLATIKDTSDALENIKKIETTQQINYEISNVKLFNANECNKLIRPYYVSKLNVIHKGFQLINNLHYYFE